MHDEVLEFWFGHVRPAQWWKKDPEFDEQIRSRFGRLHASASRCELYPWRESARGRLAEIIVLDQFSRNIHRGSAAAFANDRLALALSQEAISAGADAEVAPEQRQFFYLPFMHAESGLIQTRSIELYEALGEPRNLEQARRHKAIIDRFGRYPHRNQVLGRQSTVDEILFLKQPGSSF